MGFYVSKEFPSRFLKGEEIAGKEVPLIIRTVKREQVFSRQTNKNDQVLVVYFEKKERGVVLKKTRANDLKQATGSDNTDDWIGQAVTAYTEKKSAGGAIHDVIRFKEAKSINPDLLPPDQKKALNKELDANSESPSVAA